MKTRKSFSIVGMVMAAVFVLGLGIASANMIPFETSITGTGPYVWNYRIDLSTDQTAFAGTLPLINQVPHANLNYPAFVTIYDFVGYTGTVVSPVGWAALVQNVGFTPDDVGPADNTSIVNITWYYTGTSPISGPLSISGFSATSIYNQVSQIDYTSRGLKTTEKTIGDNVGQTQGPTGVPEPGTLLLLGLGLVGAAGFRRKFKK